MVKLGIKCHLIEPAYNFISLLARPLTTQTEINTTDNNNLQCKWIQHFLELYNDRINFLILANTKIYGSSNIDLKILQKSHKENYKDMKDIFKKMLKDNRLPKFHSNGSNLSSGSFLSNNSNNSNNSSDSDKSTIIDFSIFDTKNNTLLKRKIFDENKNIDLEYGVFRLVLFIFQYLHVFEDKSINNNLWNYCLKSSSFSKRCFLVGLLTLICQYVWTGALIYNVMIDFEPNYDVSIILIAIISTIISILYSCETFSSFYHSIDLYRFLLKLYTENPELQLNCEEEEYYYYKIRNISMKRIHIRYNLCADFLSNFILPIILPILNIFVILNTESAIDAILNSIAIFFIIQIDEELYRITEYSNNQETMIFTRWIISCIYCKYFPEYENIFKKECDTWHNSVINLSHRYRRRSNNVRVEPEYEITLNAEVFD